MVYQNFIEHQLDYIYFIYGLSFLLLAFAGYAAGKVARSRLPWNTLVLFALLHGTHDLLDTTAFALGDVRQFAALRLLLLAASFICLMEFGRAGTADAVEDKRGRFVILVLAAMSLLGARWGVDGLNSFLRYLMGLPAGLWAAAALYRAVSKTPDRNLGYACAGMVVYAVLTGFVVPVAGFLPASMINYDTFMGATGIPVQFVKMLAVVSTSIAIFSHCRAHGSETARRSAVSMLQCSYRPVVMVLVITVTGWLVTEFVGHRVEGQSRDNLLSRALTAAAAISPERVAALTGTPADEGRPDYEVLRTKIQRIKAVNPDCRFVYLMGLKGGHEVFLVDAEPKGSKDYSTPGDVYTDATQQEINDFSKGRSKVYEPYTDSWGTWVTGAAFIRDPDTGNVLAMLGMDIDARVWLHSVALSRFLCMAIIYFVCLLGLILYGAWLRSREAAEQGVALMLANKRLEDQKKLRSLVNSLGEGVIMHDAAGIVTFANPEAERLLGIGADEMAGNSVSDVTGSFEIGRALAYNGSGGLEAYRGEDVIFTRKDGSPLSVSFISSPIEEDGKPVGAVIAFQDITGRKEIERQKNDFYAMVTHDLKSPLVLVQGYSDMLLEFGGGSLDESARTMVENIRASGNKMLRMVNDFLTVSRFEFGTMQLHEGPEDICGIVRGVLAECSTMSARKGITTEIMVPEERIFTICDGAHIQRAITNLIENAVNYTGKDGVVRIGVEKADLDGQKHVLISVSDNGPGIQPADKDKIFDKYYRSARTAGLKGSGLGLAIVKAVATAHGGSVKLESLDGDGSTFKLYLPMKN
jgi:PAS domain S-box-containing protein